MPQCISVILVLWYKYSVSRPTRLPTYTSLKLVLHCCHTFGSKQDIFAEGYKLFIYIIKNAMCNNYNNKL